MLDTTTVADVVSAALTQVWRPITPAMLRQLIVSTISGDSTLRTLLGVRIDDPRVYWYYQPAATIDSTGPRAAYITYMHSALPERTQAVGEPTFSLSIWARNLSVLDAVRDRLVTLFGDDDARGVLYTLPNGRQVWTYRLGEHDNYQEDTKFAGKNLQFRLGFSQV